MYTRDQVYQQTLEYFKGDTLATDVWINKYCLKNMRGELMELTPDDMHRRIASEFARIESTFDNPIDETEVYNLIKDFRFIIPQGSPMSGIGNEQQVISLANCFVVGNGQDSYGGILNTEEQMVHLMKRRGGVGTDLSHIRPRGFAVNNAAISSAGVAPFMERYSNATREVAQDGRRGALMLTMSDRSENFEDFIDAKLETTRVTGANISVKLSDEFMVAAINDTEFEQRFPYNSDNPIHSQNVSAKKLWKKLIHNSWKSAEPGILFWDKIINESPADCYKDFGFSTVSTNPCVVGETMIFTNMGWIQIKNLEHWQSVYPELTIVTRDDKGTLTNSKLEWVGITKEQDEIFRIIFENDTELLTNKTHKLYFPDYTEVSVEELSNIAKPVAVIGADGLVNVLSVESINETRDVWDLTANPNYNFFSVMDVRPGIVSAAIITVNENIKFQCYDVITLNKGVQKFAYELAKNDRFADGTIVEKLENMYCKPETISNYFKRSILNVDCGEIPLCPTDSCRLIAINLYSFVNDPFTEIAEFDFNKFTQVVGVAQRLMDDLVELEKEKIDTIIQKIASDPEIREIKQCELDLWNRVKTTLIHGRRTGLGITAEGDMLAALGIRYGTDKATDFCENVHQTMAEAAFRSSVNLAKERGAFPIWCYELEKDNPFINRLLAADPAIEDDYQQFGRRNIAMLTIAPTGSLSLLTQTTSGIEPLFMPYYTRRRKINPNDRDAKTSFIDAVGDHWEEYKVFHNKLLLWGNINGHQLENMNHHALDDIIEKSPYYLATANEINWQEKVRMQGLIQQWCDHSIANTINLPESVTEEEIEQVLLAAWRSGCKGVTVYRDKCRSGVLIATPEENKINIFKENNAPRRPRVLPAEIMRFTNKGEKWIGILGLLDNRPYEIFTGPADQVVIPTNVTHVEIIKERIDDNNVYNLKYVDKDGFSQEYKGLSRAFNREYWNTGRLVSAILRHGMPLPNVLQLLDKLEIDNNDSITTWKAGVKRMIKKYIHDGTKVTGETCKECNSNQLIFKEGCISCANCGWSKCG